MTKQEAINLIRYRIETASRIAGRGKNGKAFEDLEMAIKALEELNLYEENRLCLIPFEELNRLKEKDIPKKPLKHYRATITIAGEKEEVFCGGFCPICKHRITSKSDYCQKCGQKIKWKNEV